jgi:hypothetical protein
MAEILIGGHEDVVAIGLCTIEEVAVGKRRPPPLRCGIDRV